MAARQKIQSALVTLRVNRWHGNVIGFDKGAGRVRLALNQARGAASGGAVEAMPRDFTKAAARREANRPFSPETLRFVRRANRKWTDLRKELPACYEGKVDLPFPRFICVAAAI